MAKAVEYFKKYLLGLSISSSGDASFSSFSSHFHWVLCCWLFLRRSVLLFYEREYFGRMYVCPLGALGGQRKALDPLELELQMAASRPGAAVAVTQSQPGVSTPALISQFPDKRCTQPL